MGHLARATGFLAGSFALAWLHSLAGCGSDGSGDVGPIAFSATPPANRLRACTYSLLRRGISEDALYVVRDDGSDLERLDTGDVLQPADPDWAPEAG